MVNKNNQITSLQMQATMMFQANRLHEAGELNYRICQLDPNNADAWHNVGYVCLQMNDLQGAEGAARKSISISPSGSR